MKWNNETRKLSDLKPSEYNPRKLSDKAAEDLTTSIDKFSLADPIIINLDNTIIGGHQRYAILKQQGVEVIDVRVPSEQLTKNQEIELNLRLNKNLGEWDYDVLLRFDDKMLADVGFDEAELNKHFENDFMPIVHPEFDTDDVTKEAIEKKAQELAEKIVNTKMQLDIACPECGHEFKVDMRKKCA